MSLTEEKIENILSIARTISESKVGNKAKYFSKIYAQFHSEYPFLFEMCCSDRFELDNLMYMMNMMRKINQGKETEETASVEVGQHMFDRYVAPLVDKLEKQKKLEEGVLP